MPPSSHSKRLPSTPIAPLDPKTIRQHVRALIRRQFDNMNHDAARQTHVALNEIWQIVEYANLQRLEGEYAQALLTLQAVTDVCTKQWMYLNDIHGEVRAFFEDLTSFWTEILLWGDLTAKEQTRWAKHMTTWQTRLAEMHMETAFDAPLAAIREGWDHPALQRVFQEISPQQRCWDGEIPSYAEVLTQARLAVLEQRGQFAHYLRLARAERQTRDYVTMAVRQGQITEAIAYGHKHLTTAEDAFALAQELFTHNQPHQSLQIAAHGLTLEGDRVPLATWLRDHAWSLKEQDLALEAGETAFRGEPTLKQYLPMAQIAGEQWPTCRAILLDYARQAPFTASPQGLVRVFLSEQLFDDAIAVLKTTSSYALVAEVVDAALEKQTKLDWVVQAYRQQAEHIMNGAKATYYQAAATWLAKARTAYHLLDQDDIWQTYLDELVERHKYKSKLLPLLKELL